MVKGHSQLKMTLPGVIHGQKYTEFTLLLSYTILPGLPIGQRLWVLLQFIQVSLPEQRAGWKRVKKVVSGFASILLRIFVFMFISDIGL